MKRCEGGGGYATAVGLFFNKKNPKQTNASLGSVVHLFIKRHARSESLIESKHRQRNPVKILET